MNAINILKKKIASTAFSLIPALLTFMSFGALAAGGGVHLDDAGNDVADTASLQRGVRNYVNYCMGCHSAKYVRFSSLGEDFGLSDDQLMENLMFAADTPDETMTIAMPSESAALWFGQAPPDLTLVARSRGTDFIYTFLRSFYVDESRPNGVNNLVLSNASMPHVLWELQGMQAAKFSDEKNADGVNIRKFEGFEQLTPGTLSPEEYDQFVRDLVNFLDYIGAPEQLERRELGVWVIWFLLFFLLLAYLLKKEVWKDVK